jgi:hypothetical protein
MDFAALATAFVSVLIPALGKGVGELATGALKDVYGAIKARLLSAGQVEKISAIESNPNTHKAELETLAKVVLEQDSTLRSRLATELSIHLQQTNNAPLVNTIEAKEGAKVVVVNQAGTINM